MHDLHFMKTRYFSRNLSKPLLTSAEVPCFRKVKKHCFKNEWILISKNFTAVIEEVGYVNFLEIAGPQNLMGGWPMVQSNWDESKFSAFKVRISIK